MKTFEQLTDDEFIHVWLEIKQLSGFDRTIENFKKSVEVMYENITLDNFLKKEVRLIDGEKYELIIKPFTKEEGPYLADWYVSKVKDSIYNQLLSDLNERLKNVSDFDEKIKRLKAEQEYVKQLVKTNEFLFAGYQAEKLNKNVSEFKDFDWQNEKKDYENCALGAAYFLFEQYLESALSNILTQEELESANLADVSLVKPSQKLILIQKLGILPYLIDNYKHKMGAIQFAQLICLIVGLNTKSNASTIRREINRISKQASKGGKSKQGEVDNGPNIDTTLEAIENTLREIGFKQKDLKALGF